MGSGVFLMPKSVLNLSQKRIIVRIREEAGEMKIGIMMRDTEYRDAMAEMISGYGKDIYVEIAGSGGVQNGSVILTDIMPSEIEASALARLSRRTVFLVQPPGFWRVQCQRKDQKRYEIQDRKKVCFGFGCNIMYRCIGLLRD